MRYPLVEGYHRNRERKVVAGGKATKRFEKVVKVVVSSKS